MLNCIFNNVLFLINNETSFLQKNDTINEIDIKNLQINKDYFKKKIDAELDNFHNDIIELMSENNEILKIQELIIYLTCSNDKQASKINCKYYIGEVIDNIQYLRKTNSVYDVGMIFNLFSNVSINLNKESNFNSLIEIYSEIQILIDEILENENKEISMTLKNMSKNRNIVLRAIILLEISKVVKHYRQILNEQSIMSSNNKLYNPNPLINITSIQKFFELNIPSTKIDLIKITLTFSKDKMPSLMIKLIGFQNNYQFEDRFNIIK